VSYTFLLEQGEESSAECFSGIPASVLSNSTRIADASCYNASATESCRASRSGMTCEHSTENRGKGESMLSAADSHAPIFHQPGPTVEPMERLWDLMARAVDYGLKWRGLLKKYNLDLRLLRTPRILEQKDLEECSKNLPSWGMMQNGECLALADSAQIISENGFSSLLPTPTSHNAKEGAYPAEFTRNTPTLAAQVGGKINPDWNEQRMGWPIKWTDLKPLGTGKYRQWLHLHGIHCVVKSEDSTRDE
jgi:hypothetical protein